LDENALHTAALAINAAAADRIVLAGDYNANGAVDAADYVLWRNTFLSTTDLAADGNGNRIIDSGDYDVWRASAGRQASRHRRPIRPCRNRPPGPPPSRQYPWLWPRSAGEIAAKFN
jgi:hypothetical protein